MKKVTIYEINDGLDGVVVAKSLKQAIKKLVPYYGYSVKDVIDDIKASEEDLFSHSYDWTLTGDTKVAKKGRYRKSKILGWCES